MTGDVIKGGCCIWIQEQNLICAERCPILICPLGFVVKTSLLMSDDVTLQDIESPRRTPVFGSNVIESITGDVLTTETLSMIESEALLNPTHSPCTIKNRHFV